MCGYCYLTGAEAAREAAVLIGGPVAYAGYRKVRRALGLRDTAVAPRSPEAAPRPPCDRIQPARPSATTVADPATA